MGVPCGRSCGQVRVRAYYPQTRRWMPLNGSCGAPNPAGPRSVSPCGVRRTNFSTSRGSSKIRWPWRLRAANPNSQPMPSSPSRERCARSSRYAAGTPRISLPGRRTRRSPIRGAGRGTRYVRLPQSVPIPRAARLRSGSSGHAGVEARPIIYRRHRDPAGNDIRGGGF